jgi:hypothetical protein
LIGKECQRHSVTRLGEFSPSGRLLALRNYTKISQLVQNFGLLNISEKRLSIYFDKMSLATFWATFWQPHLVTLDSAIKHFGGKKETSYLDGGKKRWTQIRLQQGMSKSSCVCLPGTRGSMLCIVFVSIFVKVLALLPLFLESKTTEIADCPFSKYGSAHLKIHICKGIGFLMKKG